MNSHKYKSNLGIEQRRALSHVHLSQIAAEATLTSLLLGIITVPVATAYPSYASFDISVILISFLLLFIFGLTLTVTSSKLFNSDEALAVDTKSFRRWLNVVWFTVPMLMAVIFGMGALSMNSPIMGTVGAVAALLWFLTAIVIVLVKSQQIWKRFSKPSKSPTRVIIYSVLGFCLALTAMFGTYTTADKIAFNSTSISDGNLEIGQSEIRQAGKAGEKLTTHNLLMGFTTSTSQTNAVDEIKAKGTRRYQYMYCSNGGYRYYTADQFKNPNVGFTHQSPDYCAQNGQGTQTTLADVPPAPTPAPTVVQVTRPYPTSTHCYSLTGYSLDCYSY